jgi:hypothetical protein
MSESENERTELTDEELEQQEAEPLPAREAMSVLNPSGFQPLPVVELPTDSDPL